MAHIDECVPGTQAIVRESGVTRVKGRRGTIVEVSRIRRKPTDRLMDRVTIDVPGHGEIVVAPGDLDVVSG